MIEGVPRSIGYVLRAAALLAATTALAAGPSFASGASSSAPSSYASARSTSAQTQFVARADAICAKAAKRGNALRVPSTPVGYAPFLQRVSTILTDAVRELRAVTAPPRSRAAYARLLATVSSEVERIRRAREYLRAGDLRRAQSTLEQLNSNKVNAEANALGLHECANSIEAGGA